MSEQSFTLFNSPIGTCAIAWSDYGVAGLQLPEASERATRARMQQRFPEASEAGATPIVRGHIDAVLALLAGQGGALERIELDLEGVPPFHRLVYEAARTIPPGSTLSYGEIAERAGSPGAARAVGQALRKNPFAIIVPCHRVLAAGGKVGGFTANGGVETKRKLLALERAREAAQATPTPAAELFDYDPVLAVAQLSAADARLGALIEKVGPFAMRRDRAPTLFLALAEAIVYQQLHGKAAATIWGRVKALFPREAAGPSPASLLSASDRALRGAGLSQNKLLSLQDLARRAHAGELPTLEEAASMTDDALVERLTTVRGIGRWTVEMLLLFRLGRPDVLPVDDFGVRKGYAFAFGKRAMPERAEVARRGQRWAPYRSVASWYLWRAAALADAKGAPKKKTTTATTSAKKKTTTATTSAKKKTTTATTSAKKKTTTAKKKTTTAKKSAAQAVTKSVNGQRRREQALDTPARKVEKARAR
jgi:methylated-DNA-[protein]-cysteine S-methyltransferase